jgi:hypothetical protein
MQGGGGRAKGKLPGGFLDLQMAQDFSRWSSERDGNKRLRD